MRVGVAVSERTFSRSWFYLAWLGIGVALSALAIALLVFGQRFAWERRLQDIPALELAAGLMIAGLVYGLIFPLVRATLGAHASEAPAKPWSSKVTGHAVSGGSSSKVAMLFWT